MGAAGATRQRRARKRSNWGRSGSRSSMGPLKTVAVLTELLSLSRAGTLHWLYPFLPQFLAESLLPNLLHSPIDDTYQSRARSTTPPFSSSSQSHPRVPSRARCPLPALVLLPRCRMPSRAETQRCPLLPCRTTTRNHSPVHQSTLSYKTRSVYYLHVSSECSALLHVLQSFPNLH